MSDFRNALQKGAANVINGYANQLRIQIEENDVLRVERDALRELLAEAVQWLRVSDLPCAMTIHRIDAALNKGDRDD